MVKSGISYIELPWKFDPIALHHDIIEWCEKNGETQEAVADAIGCSRGYVQNLKKPDAMPTIRNFLALCFICDLHPHEYFVIVSVADMRG